LDEIDRVASRVKNMFLGTDSQRRSIQLAKATWSFEENWKRGVDAMPTPWAF